MKRTKREKAQLRHRVYGFSLLGVFALMLIFGVVGTPEYWTAKIKDIASQSIVERLEAAAASGQMADFSACTDFDWDEGILFKTEFPGDEAINVVGRRWTTATTFLAYMFFNDAAHTAISDGQNLVVFLKEGEVVFGRVLVHDGFTFDLAGESFVRFDRAHATFPVTVTRTSG